MTGQGKRPRSRASGEREGLPTDMSEHSLSRIAHSAESLLDTIRLEAQKNLLADLYANRGAVAASLATTGGSAATAGRSRSPAALLMDSAIQDSILKPRDQHQLTSGRGHAPTLRATAIGQDFIRNAIPNPTPVKPSEDARMHLLTLNPREFFKYKYEKTNPDGIESHLNTHDMDIMSSKISPSTHGLDNSRASLGFSGLLWIHLLAGRGLRASPSSSSTTSSKQASSLLNSDP